MLALRVALNTASRPALCLTALAETAIAPTPEVGYVLVSETQLIKTSNYLPESGKFPLHTAGYKGTQ